MALKLIENIDYYIDENGMFVFTKEYLLKRGYCCSNGCKYCPYSDEDRKEQEKSKK